MKLNGKTVQKPTIEEMIDKHPLFFEKLEGLIGDDEIYKETKAIIVQLEWGDRFQELINKNHGGKLTTKRQQAKYAQFYENILEEIFKLKPYLDEVKLHIPYKQPDMHKRLKELLEGKQDALDHIYRLYPYRVKRKNKRELHNSLVDKLFDMFENKDRYLRAAKWQYLEAIENKEYIFKDVIKGRALEFKDENGNSYHTIEKITIIDLRLQNTLIEGVNYKIDAGMVVILTPMHTDLRVIISAKKQKFKSISI